jgi:hypothetical protein
MKLFRKNSRIWPALAGLVLFAVIPSLTAQTNPDELLKKKYEKILGRYEFDYSSIGGETAIVEFRIGEGALWIDDGDGRPAQLKPVNDSAVEFTGEDPNVGAIKVTFTVEEASGVVKCRLLIPQIALDAPGIKLKQ